MKGAVFACGELVTIGVICTFIVLNNRGNILHSVNSDGTIRLLNKMIGPRCRGLQKPASHKK